MKNKSKVKDLGKLANKRAFDIILVDALNYANKYFYVFRNFKDKKGNKTGIIFGLLNAVFGWKKKYNPFKIVFCWDGPINIRKSFSDDYKSDRISKGDDFWQQIRSLREGLSFHFKKVEQWEAVGYEAEDIAAKAIKIYKDNSILLLTEDTDWFQLISDKVSVYRAKEVHDKKSIEQKVLDMHGIDLKFYYIFNIIYGVGHNNVQTALNKRTSKRIIQYLKDKNVALDELNADDIINIIILNKIPLTELQIKRIQENYKLVKLYNRGYKLLIQKGKQDAEQFSKLCKRFNMNKLASTAKEVF